MRQKISKSTIDAMQKGDILVDTEVRGFVARRLPSGVVTYGFRYRVRGRQRWLALGVHGKLTAQSARKLAKKRAGEVADDRDPAAERHAESVQAAHARLSTVDALLDAFVERHVRKKLRSAGEVERVFDKYVRPRIGTKSIYELRRRDIIELLDAIEDNHGPVMADRTLAHVRKAFNWHAARDDTFVPPIVRGMARTRAVERARKRILDDEEIRDLWRALDEAEVPKPYPALMRVLLLTAQRREEVSSMRWEEIRDDKWSIPEDKTKTAIYSVVPLSANVKSLLGKPRKAGFVFSTTGGKKPFSGHSKAKAVLVAKINEHRKQTRRKPMPHWVLHDLRRTARSLMSRAGVMPDIAERVLGHAIPGVRGVYDRHSFFEEKKDALGRLGALVDGIVNS